MMPARRVWRGCRVANGSRYSLCSALALAGCAGGRAAAMPPPLGLPATYRRGLPQGLIPILNSFRQLGNEDSGNPL